MTWVALVGCVVATALADIRWLRVAQREHYLPGSVSRFAQRWWSSELWMLLLGLVAVGGVLASLLVSFDALFTAGIVAIGPIGLSLRGRTSAMVWTQRARKLATITAAVQVLLLVVGVIVGFTAPVAALVALTAPLVVDLASFIAQPIENKQADRFVVKAKQRLAQVNPLIVGVTGSYGKTSTKQYIAHFVAGTKTALATPASFNNKAGLSRTVNESLAPGTDVFIAEMGTYGQGEIRELCELCPPTIAVITAIGPVHLERFGSEDAIVTAKSEIFEHASVAVLNVDDPRLANLVNGLQAGGKKVWRVGSTSDADVVVSTQGSTTTVTYDGRVIASSENVDAPLTNIACSVAVALELGVAESEIALRLGSLPVPKHRQEVTLTPDGLVVIDDTFNANPASVRRGLAMLAAKAPGEHRRIVATPGMVELGDRQDDENRAFAEEAAKLATDIVVIGKTNRKALVEAATAAGLNTVVVDRLPQAVAWVRHHVGEGDAVLYANDLPDHFP